MNKLKKTCKKPQVIFYILRYLIMFISLFYVISGYIVLPLINRFLPSLMQMCPQNILDYINSFLVANSGKLGLNNSNVLLVALFIFIYTFIFGRAFCAFFCPLGTVQEVFGKLGMLLRKKVFHIDDRFKIPSKVAALLRYVKYLLLGISLFSAWYFGIYLVNVTIFKIPFMQAFFPWLAIEYISKPSVMFSVSIVAVISFILICILCMFDNRFYCKYLCPTGAIYSLVSKFGLTKLKKDGITFIKRKINSLIYITLATSIFFAGMISLRIAKIEDSHYNTEFMLSDYVEYYNQYLKESGYTKITVKDFLASYGLIGIVPEDSTIKEFFVSLRSIPFDKYINIKFENQMSTNELAKLYKIPKETDLTQSWETVMRQANAAAVVESEYGDLYMIEGNTTLENVLTNVYPDSGLKASSDMLYGELIPLIDAGIDKSYNNEKVFKEIYKPCCINTIF